MTQIYGQNNDNQNQLPAFLNVLALTAQQNLEYNDRIAFFDTYADVGFAGLRSSYGAGLMLTKVNVDLFDYRREIPFPTIFDFEKKDYERFDGLLGRYVNETERELLNVETLQNIFNAKYEEVTDRHVLLLNPKQWIKYIENEIRLTNVFEKAISIMPMALSNADSHILAKLAIEHGDVVYADIQTRDGIIGYKVNDSLIEINADDHGRDVLVEFIGEVNGERVVRIIKYFDPGVFTTIRHFPSGQVPYQGAQYSVIPGQYRENGVDESNVKKFEFLEGQNKITANKGPMLTFPLSIFHSAMLQMAESDTVALYYTDEITPVLFQTVDAGQSNLQVEIIASPLIPTTAGRQLTL